MVTPLCEIAYKYKTDKCPQILHNYTPYYYETLKDRRLTVKKVLEIGIGYKETMPSIKDYVVGASLFMWRDFFPNAIIYGIDISDKAMIKADRIQTFLCNQSKEHHLLDLIKKIGTDIDVVIDDGSHRKEHQILTVKTLLPLLKKDVFYAIEDVIFTDTIPRRLKQFNWKKIRPIRLSGRPDGLLVAEHK
jgi:hypothetical protein